MPPREGERELDALLRKGEHEVDVPPQGSPKEGKGGRGREALRQSECEVPPRRRQNKDALATWDPGGKLPRKWIFEAKGPVDATESDPGQHRPPTKETRLPEESVRQHNHKKMATHLGPYRDPTVPSCHQGVHLFFCLEAYRGRGIVPGVAKALCKASHTRPVLAVTHQQKFQLAYVKVVNVNGCGPVDAYAEVTDLQPSRQRPKPGGRA